MKLIIKQIPKAALYFYLVGFLIIGICLLIYFQFPSWFSAKTLLQLFIGGAIIVCIGSVINTIAQFKKPNKPY